MNENAELRPPVQVVDRARSTLGLLAAIALLTLAAPAQALPDLSAEEARKLDPLLAVAVEPLLDENRAVASAAAATLSPVGRVAGVRLAENGPVVDLLIRVRGGDTSGLSSLGIVPDAVVGEVATARAVPLVRLPDLARRAEVASLEAARPLKKMNDVSVPDTRAPEVWDQFGATGRGVLIGIVDTGIDWDHPDFQGFSGDTRIKLLLDLSQPGSGPFGGRLFTEEQINQGITSRDPVGHGTHVAGTAAGGGMADLGFRGVAPEADLIIVNADRSGNGSFTTADVVNGLSFIDEQAAILEQPYVANLSLGGHNGAHDGSELEERAIDELVGPGKPGKAIVAAAGNERGTQSHAAADVGPGALELRVQVPSYTAQPGVQNDLLLINLWYEAFSAFAVSVVTPGGETVGPFSPGQSNGAAGTATQNGLVAVQNAVGGASPNNGDFQCSVLLIDSPTLPAPGTWKILVSGDTGHFDAYVAQSTIPEAHFANHVDTIGFVGEPGSARNAITVGAYMTKTEWTDADGNDHDLRDFGLNLTPGEVAPFSNAGPTRDGRIKPELSAPGAEIGSAYSLDAPPSSPVSIYQTPFPQFPNFFLLEGGDPPRYAIQQGTSQASPHVAGAVALLFELHPEWDTLDVKHFLTSTARADAFTGQLPNALFGYGKLDILEAVLAAGQVTIPPGDVDDSGTTDIADAILAISFILGSVTPTPEEEQRADMNSDLRLDVGDVVLIVDAALGAPPTPLAGGGFATPDDATRAPSSDADSWTVSIALAADQPVAGMDIQIESESALIEPAPDALRGTRDGVLALAAAGAPSTVRIVALAVDGGDLGGESPILVLPFEAPGGTVDAAASWRVTRVRLLGGRAEEIDGSVIVGAPQRVPAANLRLLPVAPNPAASSTSIAFDLPGTAATRVKVGIYDVTGRLVVGLADEPMPPGRHEITWTGLGDDGRPPGAGVYWVRVRAGDEVATTRLTVLR